ncbi:MAG: DNA primase, partial [Candidatus Methanomethylophilus sp.]|nr:DNA primase [Methanomethylophilus sp.]
FERKKREFSRRDSEFDEEAAEEKPVRVRRRFADEEPETESVITETEEGEIVIDEVEVTEEKIEEPVAEPAAEEPVEEEVAETAEEPVEEVPEVKEEPVAEEPVAEPAAEEPEEEKTEEPAEEEPKKAIRAPVKRKTSKKDKVLTEEQENYRAILSEISGTKNSVLIDAEGNILDKVEVKNLANYLKDSSAENITTIVFDGVISQNILDISSGKGIKTLVGKNKGKIAKLPAEITIWTRTDLL